MSWPEFGDSRNAMYGVAEASTAGTTVTSGNANTKGAWAELSAGIDSDATALILYVASTIVAMGTLADFLIDLGIGAAGSEQVIVSNILLSSNNNTLVGGTNDWVVILHVPVSIPAGTRLAVRCQCSTASKTIVAYCQAISGSFLSSAALGLVTTYGANEADSGGTQVDTGATVSTKGAYSEISAATTYPIRWLYLCLGSLMSNSTKSSLYKIDVSIGAAGSEVVVIPDISAYRNVTFDLMVPQVRGPFPTNIPAGSRLAVRASNDQNDAVSRYFDAVIIGVT